MPEAARSNRMLLMVFGTGAAIGLQSGLFHLFMWRSPAALFSFLGGSFLFSGVTYALWRWVFPRLASENIVRQVVLEVLVSLVVVTVLSLVTVDILARALGGPSLFGTPVGAEQHLTITPEMRQRSVWMYAILPIAPTLLMTMLGYHQYWWRILMLQTRERELRELAATAQLAALRAQINPHFLFNSLNSIAQLIHTDPDRAETCVQRLAEIFRYLLRRAEKEFVPLSEELQVAEAYLDIERARFGERLRVETHIDPASTQHLIPNLILQPLVENAIKHGLSRKVGGGTVHIDAALRGEVLTLAVRDDGMGMSPAALAQVYEHGVGLRNLRDRLARLYGPTHLPHIESQPGGGTSVRLYLPVPAPEAVA